MNFYSSQFQYQPDTKSYVAEASDLAIGTPGQYITLDGYSFMFVGVDKDASGEDTYGWNYKPTMNSIELNPAMQGHKVLIIND